MRFKSLILSFTVAMLVGLISPTVNANPQALACCDNAAVPSSCWVPDSPNDLTECDPAAELAMCEIDAGFAIACEPIDLECCPTRNGVIMLDYCLAFNPGLACAGAVIVAPAEPPEMGQCCRCSDVEGEHFANCEDVWTESCQSGWDFGPLVCGGDL